MFLFMFLLLEWENVDWEYFFFKSTKELQPYFIQSLQKS